MIEMYRLDWDDSSSDSDCEAWHNKKRRSKRSSSKNCKQVGRYSTNGRGLMFRDAMDDTAAPRLYRHLEQTSIGIGYQQGITGMKAQFNYHSSNLSEMMSGEKILFWESEPRNKMYRRDWDDSSSDSDCEAWHNKKRRSKRSSSKNCKQVGRYSTDGRGLMFRDAMDDTAAPRLYRHLEQTSIGIGYQQGITGMKAQFNYHSSNLSEMMSGEKILFWESEPRNKMYRRDWDDSSSDSDCEAWHNKKRRSKRSSSKICKQVGRYSTNGRGLMFRDAMDDTAAPRLYRHLEQTYQYQTPAPQYVMQQQTSTPNGGYQFQSCSSGQYQYQTSAPQYVMQQQTSTLNGNNSVSSYGNTSNFPNTVVHYRYT
ncbi:uncharacterized protein LOC134218077 [Armigeres subalbatus]|uniref:uncharacterized protein LOC134218077 n=1 Tax=Armigeres subalbatus TaxID=124917 RepID=UPI002ED33E7A